VSACDRAVVVGAGLAGLRAAESLRRAGVLVESYRGDQLVAATALDGAPLILTYRARLAPAIRERTAAGAAGA